jgi:type IV pilus assembly protein PilM
LAVLSLSTIGNAFSYQRVTSRPFADAEAKATAFSGEVTGLQTNYDAQTGAFTATQEKLNSLTVGRRDLSWANVMNAVIDCLPRDEEDVEDISKKNVMSITEISADRMADLSSWHTGLIDHQKVYMTPDNKTTAPAGQGYIFTVKGYHFHNNPSDTSAQGVQYVAHAFLKNLQKAKVERPGYPPREVGDLGISHATIVDQLTFPVMRGPKIEFETNASRIRGGATGIPNLGAAGIGGGYGDEYDTFSEYGGGGGYPGAGGGYPGAGGGYPGIPGQPNLTMEEIERLERTNFIVQFVYQNAADAAAAPVAAPADDYGYEDYY